MNKEDKISIAVLPFRHLGKDEDYDYFCDGMTEDIINALANIDELKVISRTSSFYFKNHKASLKEIADELKVSLILEGSVRRSVSRIRISAQLIDVEQDTQFWNESWDRDTEDFFAVQDEISLKIADKIREEMGHLEIGNKLMEFPTNNQEAYENCLKGRFHFKKWNPTDANLAIEFYSKAKELDEGLIDAHLGLADAYSFLAVAGYAPREESWKKAADGIKKAMEIDADNPGLNFMLANQYFFTEASFSNGIHFLKKALANKPTHSESRSFLACMYSFKNDFKKAQEHLYYAKSIDPLNPETLFFEANYLYRKGEYDNAEQILDKLLEDNERNVPALISSISIKIKKGQLKEAERQLGTAPDGLFNPDEKLGMGCLIAIAKGESNLEKLIERAKDPIAHQAHAYLFMAYARLGEKQKAFEVLNNVFENKSSILLIYFTDPLSENLFNEKEYSEFHKKLYSEKDEIIESRKKEDSSKNDAELKAKLEQLKTYMDEQEPYLNPSLSLRTLADYIDIHPNQLSYMLNEFVGKNFNQFINHYRIERFKSLIKDDSNSHISIIGLAYESGFNSKTVFNTAFKKELGITPKEYQKSQS